MTTDEFNQTIERFEISMLDMPATDRFDILLSYTQDRYRLTGQVHVITDLLTLLPELNGSYVHLALCRAICNLLYIYDN